MVAADSKQNTMIAVWTIALGVLILITLISVMNTLSFPRLGRLPTRRISPRVSVLIPARNEADKISETVAHLLRQDYPNYEVIVLDDGSTDGTADRALEAAAGNTCLRVVSGEPLPEGWLGKNWACHQLSQLADGEVLVFTDADVRWEPGALMAVVALADRTRADLLAVWPTQATHTWTERLVVPMMTFVVMAYLPELAVRYIPWPVFAAANGQCLVFRRPAYDQIGGHVVVRANIIEDVGLAWETKRKHLRLVMADGHRLIGGRMYRSWREVRAGFAKNILAGHANQPAWLLLSAAFHWMLFLMPWLWLAAGWAVNMGPGWPWFPLAMIALGVGVRALTAVTTHQRAIDALLLPVSVVLLTVIAAQSLWWHFCDGGPQWKGRKVTHRA